MWSENVELIRTTPKALLCRYEGDEQWIARSQVHANSEIYSDDQLGETALLVIPEWLAEEKGWS